MLLHGVTCALCHHVYVGHGLVVAGKGGCVVEEGGWAELRLWSWDLVSNLGSAMYSYVSGANHWSLIVRPPAVKLI